MKIRAVANGNIIDAHPDAAKQLIEAGIYEAVSEKESQSAKPSAVPPGSVRGEGSPAAVRPKRRRKTK